MLNFLFSRPNCSPSHLQVLAGVAATLFSAPVFAPSVFAQDDIVPELTTGTEVVLEGQISRGESLFEAGDSRALQILADASRASLDAISANGGRELLTAMPERIPERGPLGDLSRRAARAHLAWGRAADRFGNRDIAITALSRAYRLAGTNRLGTNRVSRDAQFQLSALVREGLPMLAADDTLDTLSSLALWKPLKWRFDVPIAALGPNAPTTNRSVELMITQGKAFPPENRDTRAGTDKAVVAPLYRNVRAEALPPVLKLGYMTAGFERESGGPNKGMWKQVAQVFYPHPIFTRENRDDRPRAEALCAQFLRLRAINRSALGLTNPYASNGITSLWLSEVSALWPNDDDDPELAYLRGARMPKVNTQGARINIPTEVEEAPLTMPWLAAGQVDFAPGDIVFFKTPQRRSEIEWLRELAHEYGHVLLPPVGGFRPPIEPFANGLIGETLGMMWVGANAPSFDVATLANQNTTAASPVVRAYSDDISRPRPRVAPQAVFNNSPVAMRQSALVHVSENALPALRLWGAQGPNSRLRRDFSPDGLKYLQGFCVWAERVYGAQILGMASRGAIERSARSFGWNKRIAPTNAGNLLTNFESAMRGAMIGRSALPVWLPGALETVPNIPAAQLIARAPLAIRAREQLATRLFVPNGATRLHLEGKGAVGALKSPGFSATNVKPELAGNTFAIEIDVSQKSGWQRLVWSASTPLTVQAAWFGTKR